MVLPIENWCRLPATVHPILSQGNWVFDDAHRNEKLWLDLQPALRFATHILSSDIPLLWWTHLLFGELVRTSNPQLNYLRRTEKSWNPAALEEVKQHLTRTAAGHIKFAFSDQVGTAYGDSRWAWKIMIPVLAPLTNQLEKLQQEFHDKHFVLTSYNPAFRDYFVSGTRSFEQDVKTSFLLGLVVVHEIAHSVNRLTRNKIPHFLDTGRGRACSNIDEPFFNEAEVSRYLGKPARGELGWCLEDYLFGLQFHADMTSKYGALNLRHQAHRQHPDEKAVSTWTYSVLRFFRQEKWEEIRNKTVLNPAAEIPATRYCVHYDYLPLGSCCWIVWVPNAALVHALDCFFTVGGISLSFGHLEHAPPRLAVRRSITGFMHKTRPIRSRSTLRNSRIQILAQPPSQAFPEPRTSRKNEGSLKRQPSVTHQVIDCWHLSHAWMKSVARPRLAVKIGSPARRLVMQPGTPEESIQVAGHLPRVSADCTGSPSTEDDYITVEIIHGRSHSRPRSSRFQNMPLRFSKRSSKKSHQRLGAPVSAKHHANTV
jgi:hypothetical protein